MTDRTTPEHTTGNEYRDAIPDDRVLTDPVPDSTEGWPPTVGGGGGATSLLAPPKPPADIEVRQEYVDEYAWAIPNTEAIATCVEYGPLVEMGAGTGYWAHLIREAGGEIVAYDNDPPDDDAAWSEVLHGVPDAVERHPEKTLLLCWPPYKDRMGADTLDIYADAGGERLIYVGEPRGGSCGDREFHDRLESDWTLVETVTIPRWDVSLDARDELQVYELDTRGRARRQYEAYLAVQEREQRLTPTGDPVDLPDEVDEPAVVLDGEAFEIVDYEPVRTHSHSMVLSGRVTFDDGLEITAERPAGDVLTPPREFVNAEDRRVTSETVSTPVRDPPRVNHETVQGDLVVRLHLPVAAGEEAKRVRRVLMDAMEDDDGE